MVEKHCIECHGEIRRGFYDQNYCRTCQEAAFKRLPMAVREHIKNMIYEAKEDVLETIELRDQYG